ncbi:hypothetical protein FIA58_004535 [Flavobacterium jejuense]|uniref:Lipoprotein n=1 Tax=Flavobacterium jejuense TaxID=1544455 RepID=A0ABX0IMJ4_9FLAO|nr:hypothetical protein [Flavobacterium jejuense]NHN24938.1 hypothetical protein [Flavobacterium jejuense]
MKKTVVQFSILILLGISFCVSCKPKEEDKIEQELDLAVVTSTLPQDVLPSCVIDSTEFNSWFESGKATENGTVNAANSVTFGHKDNCDFYKWSEQMFLWITSPSKVAGKTVFESPVFYTVSSEFGNNERKLIPHTPGMLLSAMPTLEKSINEDSNDSEEGQATGDALMSKDSVMIYYITMVNDVYAQFLSAVNAGKMGGKQFPTTQAELDSIVNYAKMNKMVLPDANALALELKTSWVEASTINPKELSNYLIIDAYIPTYKKTPTKWTILNKTIQVKLALLGVHIVGSTAGHPEMVWSTFEHQKTAPALSYSYLDTNNAIKTVAANTGSDWILNSNANDTVTINISHMKFKADSIYANFKGAPANNTVSPSNSSRTKPWGVANAGVPNPENASVEASNSQVISINNSIHSKLVGNDIRKNYFFIGSTWTDSGLAPNGSSYSTTNSGSGVAIGTSQLANSTMETYIQNGTGYNENGSCFLCHSNNNGLKPTDLSHVYGDIMRWKQATVVQTK